MDNLDRNIIKEICARMDNQIEEDSNGSLYFQVGDGSGYNVNIRDDILDQPSWAVIDELDSLCKKTHIMCLDRMKQSLDQ